MNRIELLFALMRVNMQKQGVIKMKQSGKNIMERKGNKKC